MQDEELRHHTSFKIGGSADLFIYVNNLESLKILVSEINKNGTPFYIIGNGSNLLAADDGYRGVILSFAQGFKYVKISKENTVECGAGAALAKTCVFAMQNGLSGLEFAWGIPGSAGGALFMNAGAYGEDISNSVKSAVHITPDGTIHTLNKEQMELSYRHSIYSDKPGIITSIVFELQKSSTSSIKQKMYENILKRKSKQPLNYPNAGSIFKRPDGGYFAAALIEQCGLKGTSVGGAMVSPKHAGFIVNEGSATCSDVINLINLIKNKVYAETGVILECEIKTIGNVNL